MSLLLYWGIKMIRTKLICPRKYARELNLSLTEEGWKRLIVASRRFKPMYSENIPAILAKIPHYSGLK
jgi:hypothetical protein